MQNVVEGIDLGTGETSAMTQLEVAGSSTQVTRRAVTLVDVDIHPVMLPPEQWRRLPERWARHLERYGRRAPFVTDLYPRPRNKGMRADSWPEGGIPGSSYELLREQLLDEHDVDFGILLCLNAQDRATSTAGYVAADLNRVVNEWLVEEWLDRDDRLRSCDLRAARPPRARDRGDRALGGRRPLRPGPAPGRRRRSRSARASTGRCTRRPPTPACRSRSTPAATRATAARAGRRSTSRSTRPTASSCRCC